MKPETSREQETNWQRTYEEFVARKTIQAQEAHIPGYENLIDHTAQHQLRQFGNDWSRKLFGGPFYESQARRPELPAVSAVFVQSKDGNTGASNPGDLGGGETDYHLIYEGLSRVAADAVMAGANTVRGSNKTLSVWHPELVALRETLGLQRHPTQIVTTESGNIDLDAELMFNVPDLNVVILTSDAGRVKLNAQLKSRPWITTLSTGSSSDLTAGLRQLKSEYGINNISLIGGRTLSSQLKDEGIVSDLYLTTSNIEAGEPNTPYYVGSKVLRKQLILRKAGTGPEEGVVFEHFALE